VPNTTRTQPGRLSSRFWRLLGASTEKDRTRSLSQVSDASEYDEKAAGLKDEKLRKAAGLLNLDDLADSEDISQFLAIAREADASRGAALLLAKNTSATTDAATLSWRDALPPGLVSDHIRNLVVKAETQASGRVDQTLLLRSLADRLRGSNGFGAFASDTLMKLGLLGTIIGFIVMLAPIAGLDATDRAMMKSSMGLMSDGMAIAMYTTLAGLVGSILLKVQYYMLDAATARVFSQAVTLTETRVVPALERVHER